MFNRSIKLCLLAALGSLVASFPAIGESSSPPVSQWRHLPDSWFIDRLNGKRIRLDGHELDLRIQYMLQPGKAAEAAPKSSDPFATAEGRATIRAGANREWIERSVPGPKMASIDNISVPGRAGKIAVRVYHPKASGKLPILVYYHGGGWLFGNLDASDSSNRMIADEAKVIVVSVNYRLSPEWPYPAAWNDAEDSYDWVAEHAGKLGGVASRICVGGDSAGGNLAIAVIRRKLAAGEAAPMCELLYYPAVDNRAVDQMKHDYLSARLFGKGFNLDSEFTTYVLAKVFPGADLKAPEISPLFAPDIHRMPPTLVAASGFDPLRDSDRAYAARLKRAGVSVTYCEFPTLIHGFLQHTAVTPEADNAVRETARLFAKLARGAGLRTSGAEQSNCSAMAAAEPGRSHGERVDWR